jgi:hypothetical protein
MLKRFIICVLTLLTGLLWIGAAPSHAAGESWSITDVNAAACGENDWSVDVHFEGLVPGAQYLWHTQLVSDGKQYMNEGFLDDRATASGDETWTLYRDFSYEPSKEPGTFPLTPGKPMRVVLTLETTQRAVLSSWTLVAKSCDSTALLYNGPTAADLDSDYLATPQDLCPALRAFTANGCPAVDRTLTLRAKADPRRVVGRLSAAGDASLYAGRPVTIWKVRPGPDRAIATKTTSSLGKIKARVGRGRYYATAPAVVVPTFGDALAEQSATTRVR